MNRLQLLLVVCLGALASLAVSWPGADDAQSRTGLRLSAPLRGTVDLLDAERGAVGGVESDGMFGTAFTWVPTNSSISRVQSVFPGDGCEGTDEVVLTKKQLAWRCWYHVNSGDEISVFVVERGAVRPVMLGTGWTDSPHVGNLVGGSSSIAFNSGRGPVLWRVSGRSDAHAQACPNGGARRCIRIGTHLVAAAADGRSIAAWRGQALVLLDFEGRVRKELRISGSGPALVVLRGTSVFVEQRHILTRHSSVTGRPTGRWRIGGEIEDIDAGLVAYTTKDYSRLWIMRLSDGRRGQISPPAHPGYFAAALDETGLFYTYSFYEIERLGRIEFRPMRRLERVLR